MYKTWLFHKNKHLHEPVIHLCRVGDFYETYGEDAVVLSEICGITLSNSANRTYYLSGFPSRLFYKFAPKLIRAKFKVAVIGDEEKPKRREKQVDPLY